MPVVIATSDTVAGLPMVAKVLENIEHLGDRLDCRAFQFATNGANHSGLRSSVHE